MKVITNQQIQSVNGGNAVDVVFDIGTKLANAGYSGALNGIKFGAIGLALGCIWEGLPVAYSTYRLVNMYGL